MSGGPSSKFIRQVFLIVAISLIVVVFCAYLLGFSHGANHGADVAFGFLNVNRQCLDMCRCLGG